MSSILCGGWKIFISEHIMVGVIGAATIFRLLLLPSICLKMSNYIQKIFTPLGLGAPPI